MSEKELAVWRNGKKIAATNRSLQELLENGDVRSADIRSDAIVTDPHIGGELTVWPLRIYLKNKYKPEGAVSGVREQVRILNETIDALEELFSEQPD